MRAALAIMLVLSVAGLVSVASAQEAVTPSAGGKELTVYVSALVYNNPFVDSLSVVEFPFTLNRSDYEFFRPDSNDAGYYARIFAQVTVTNPAGAPVDSVSTYFSVRVNGMAEAQQSDITLFNRLTARLRSGIYAARLLIIDAVSKRSQQVTLDPFAVAPPQKGRLELAGGTLAYRISYMNDSAAAAMPQLMRNGYRILYDPLGVYKAGDSTAYAYAELYNLRFDSSTASTYRMSFSVYGPTGDLVRDYGYRDIVKPGTSAVVTQSLDITDLPSGSYTLRIAAADPASGLEDSIKLPLRIINDAVLASMLSERPRQDAYDSLSLTDKINLTSALLTPNDKTALDELTDSGKANFLNQFWRERRQVQGATSVVGRGEMVERYQYSLRSFSTDAARTNGWGTDRGRIYIVYGKWDQKDEVQSPRVGNPFVIWHYRNIKGGTVFVFQDRQGYNDFVLVHSNAPGERYDNGWAKRLKEEMFDIY